MSIKSTNSIKYLGVHIDKDVKMTTHIRKTCEKANKTYMALARITSNIGGLSAKKRLTLANVVTSIILYGAPIWAHVLRFKHYEKLLESLNR